MPVVIQLMTRTTTTTNYCYNHSNESEHTYHKIYNSKTLLLHPQAVNAEDLGPPTARPHKPCFRETSNHQLQIVGVVLLSGLAAMVARWT